ncbi:MAG: DUF5706 domain-containing protein [Syntrophobacterales bacterium]
MHWIKATEGRKSDGNQTAGITSGPSGASDTHASHSTEFHGRHESEYAFDHFGDFVRLPYEEFEMAMEEVMNDPSLTYEVQVRELYTLGTFLAKKKYLFLRLAYITFIIGSFASAVIGLFSGVLS